MPSETRRIAVVGGGPAGYPAAFLAADLGMDVTWIDEEPVPGGTCLHRGCIPSKALLHAARILEDAREAESLGIRFGPPELRLDALRDWKNGVIRKLAGGLRAMARARGIRRLHGRAEFTGEASLGLRLADGSEREEVFEAVVLATGSRPATLPGLPDHPAILDSTGALELASVPGRLLVIGGGYIGLELGSVYAALGARVTVVEMLGELLPGADPDLVAPLARRLGRRFEAIHRETRVGGAVPEGDRVRVSFRNAVRGDWEETFDRVLVAVGRRPNSGRLGLEAAGVETDAGGFVRVDDRRRTSNPRVYAAGDVAGEPMLAHKGTHEARVAIEVIAGRRSRFEPRAIPAVVFTDPEIAWAGLTVGDAAREGRKVATARFPWAASGRAQTLNRTEGLTQLVLEPETERILGIGLCGPGAGDLVAEGALAIEMGATAGDLAWTIHPHPTLSETLMEAAESFSGRGARRPPDRR